MGDIERRIFVGAIGPRPPRQIETSQGVAESI
jgi:hypothetical protein